MGRGYAALEQLSALTEINMEGMRVPPQQQRQQQQVDRGGEGRLVVHILLLYSLSIES